MHKNVGANLCFHPKPIEKFMVSGDHIEPPLHLFVGFFDGITLFCVAQWTLTNGLFNKLNEVNIMTEEEKIFKGALFSPSDPQLKALKLKAHNLNIDYNKLYEHQTQERQEILRNLIGELGENCFFQGPITFHYGSHTKIGNDCFFNFNITIQDDTWVEIGNSCAFGPNVTIVTPVHPLIANERKAIADREGNKRYLCYAKPVTIGNNCWIGANVVICPGITIGDDCVIGAGSVVVKNLPNNTFCAGNPCKVIREITDADSINYKLDVICDNTIV